MSYAKIKIYNIIKCYIKIYNIYNIIKLFSIEKKEKKKTYYIIKYKTEMKFTFTLK